MSPLEFIVILVIMALNAFMGLIDLLWVALDKLIDKLLDWLDARGWWSIAFD